MVCVQFWLPFIAHDSRGRLKVLVEKEFFVFQDPKNVDRVLCIDEETFNDKYRDAHNRSLERKARKLSSRAIEVSDESDCDDDDDNRANISKNNKKKNNKNNKKRNDEPDDDDDDDEDQDDNND